MHNRAQQPNLAQVSRARIRDSEDRIEDGGEVYGVDGARKVRGDDGAGVREAVAGLVGEGASLDTVELEVNPPDAGDGHHAPESHLAGNHWQG